VELVEVELVGVGGGAEELSGAVVLLAACKLIAIASNAIIVRSNIFPRMSRPNSG
jgi:hypothetical protein